MSRGGRLVWLWAPVVAFMVAVLTLPGGSIDALHDRVWDKASHTLAYGLFGWFCLRAFHGGVRPLATGATLGALGWALAFGAIDEWLQTQSPDRVGSWKDFIADALGIACALPLYGLTARLRGRRQGSEA